MQQGSQQHQEPQAVAGVPRLFVGQLPTDRGDQDLLYLFSPYGKVEKITMVRGPEGRSRGCAMVQFQRWAEAEAAMDSVNGSSPWDPATKAHPLVVHFANPRRNPGGQAAEPAITPRKLFVGQIPKTANEPDLVKVFAPFGEVQQVNVLKTKGVHAGCAFVEFLQWASCEAAIEALHKKLVMPGCEHPLVVKFADAKKPPTDPAVAPVAQKQRMGVQILGGGMLAMGGYGAPHPALIGGHYADGSMAAMAAMTPHMGVGMTSMALPGLPLGAMGGMMAGSMGPGMGMPAPLALGAGIGSRHSHSGISSIDGGSTDSLLHHDGGLDSDRSSSLHMTVATPSGMGLALNGNGGVHRQQLHPHAAHHNGLHTMGSMHSSLPSNGSIGSMQGMVQSGMAVPGLAAAYLTSPNGECGLPLVNGQHMMGAMAPQLPHTLQHSGPMRVGRGVTDPVAYAHKLFVGQVPFEAGEQDLWALFSPAGEILELAILRSQGRSKGCAFLTYASRAQAVTAINAFNGRQIVPNKKLVVKFADQKAPAPQHQHQQQAGVMPQPTQQQQQPAPPPEVQPSALPKQQGSGTAAADKAPPPTPQ